MKNKINRCRHLLLSGLILSGTCISSCYYQPDLRGQTIGSGVGAIAGGTLALGVTSELTALGAGIITGSVFGVAIGEEADKHTPLRMEDPITAPAPLIYYTTLRAPLIPQCFFPGQILTNQDEHVITEQTAPFCGPKVNNG